MSPVAIETGVVSGLVPIAVWLWMARMGGPLVALLTWPFAAAAAGLLWYPAATAFYKPHDFAPAQPPDAGPA